MDLTKDLRNIRRRIGKTQKEMGMLLGIPQTTWASYEAGKANPPLKILRQLADLGYGIEALSTTGIIVGNNNMQAIGDNNQISTSNNNDDDDAYLELFELIRNYATPKMLKELKEKLLKIKEAIDG